MNKFAGSGAAAVVGLPCRHFPAPLEPGVVIGASCVVAKPAGCANEATREAKTTTSAKAHFTEVCDTGKRSMIRFTRTLNGCKAVTGSNASAPLN
jgi:hypothetical protein